MATSDLLIQVVKSGTNIQVDKALKQLSKDINKLSVCEATPLAVAVWRNHAVIVEQLLKAGSNPDVPDGESGWTSLHCALYYGHLRIAARLLAAGASLDVYDHKDRTPLDLTSHQLKALLPTSTRHVVYSWGSGVNYQLGTGSAALHDSPVRVDNLAPLHISALAAAKFHSAAIGSDGRVYTWGWGRGGRLGHPDFHIHSGEAAQIAPRPVAGFGRRQVVSLAAAKHHMLAATSAGELYSWGSNRDGKLGYGAVDTQPIPKKVAAIRGRVVVVAAANKHSAALTAAGEVFTWGANGEGQLGYGTSDSGSSPNPRVVEALKGKSVTGVAAAKRHTVVMLSSGEVLTWGHKQVAPRRLKLEGARRLLRADGSELVLHRGQAEALRPTAVAVAAGAVHSCAVTATGHVLYWWSADPSLTVHELRGPIADARVLRVSCSKSRSAAVTDEGDVWVWEGEVARTDSGLPSEAAARVQQERAVGKCLVRAAFGEAVVPERVAGLKRITQVAVGEKHTLALHSWAAAEVWDSATAVADEAEEEAFDAEFDDMPQLNVPSQQPGLSARLAGADLQPAGESGLRSLQELCQVVVARELVEPRSVLQIMEYADLAGAAMLRAFCMLLALRNLDAVLLEARGALEALPEHLLAEMEAHYRAAVLLAEPEAGPAGRLSSASSTDQLASLLGSSPQPAGRSIDSDTSFGSYRPRAPPSPLQPGLRPSGVPRSPTEGDGGTLHPVTALSLLGSSPAWTGAAISTPHDSDPSTRGRFMAGASGDGSQPTPVESASRLKRVLHRKLQQISLLEARQATGAELDGQQLAKMGQKAVLQEAIHALDRGASATEVQEYLVQAQAVTAKLAAAADGRAVRRNPTKLVKGRTAGPGSTSQDATTSQQALTPQQTSSDAAAAPQHAAVGASTQEGRCSDVPEASQPRTPVQQHVPDSSPSSSSMQPSTGGKSRAPKWRGGLSTFLTETISTIPAAAPPVKEEPVINKPATPAWGGARPAASPASSSLRTILNEQLPLTPPAVAPAPGNQPRPAGQQQPRPSLPAEGRSRLPLAAFLPSSPMPVVTKKPEDSKQQPSSSPAWGSHKPPSLPGSSPPSAFSLLDIQSEQMSQLLLHRPGSSATPRRPPPLPSSSRTAPAVLGSSPPSAGSKWYVPDRVCVQPMTEIQSQEVLRSIQQQEAEQLELLRLQEQQQAERAAQSGRGRRRGGRHRGRGDGSGQQADMAGGGRGPQALAPGEAAGRVDGAGEGGRGRRRRLRSGAHSDERAMHHGEPAGCEAGTSSEEQAARAAARAALRPGRVSQASGAKVDEGASAAGGSRREAGRSNAARRGRGRAGAGSLPASPAASTSETSSTPQVTAEGSPCHAEQLADAATVEIAGKDTT